MKMRRVKKMPPDTKPSRPMLTLFTRSVTD
jgi:hypothetical protein